MSNSTRCAACRYLRRRCSEDCVLAPYFPSSHPERFACVHRIFGASNVSRLLQQLPVQQRGVAADAISSEAYWRVRDPVYGIVGVISSLQQEIYEVQRELSATQAHIAMYSVQQHGQSTQAVLEPDGHLDIQSSDQFSMNHQPFPGFYQPPNFS